jgi:hypothetical protein
MEGCHRLGTRDWYLMHYSNPFVTRGQKHTHTHRPLVLSLCRLVVASPLDAPPTCPLVAPPSHPLSAPADCRITSCCPLVALPSRPFIMPAGCCIVSPCVTLLSSHRAGWLMSYLSLCHQLVLSLCRPLTAPAGCFVASIKHCRRHQMPSNATATAATAATVAAAAIVDRHLRHCTIVHCQRKRQQQHHHQHANGSTNVKTFTSPDNLDLF